MLLWLRWALPTVLFEDSVPFSDDGLAENNRDNYKWAAAKPEDCDNTGCPQLVIRGWNVLLYVLLLPKHVIYSWGTRN